MTAELIEISAPDQDRYATLKLISWWSQERLRNARVMVVGAGALGNEVLKNLALLGVGRILVVDFDTIQADNLSRSILFRRQDVGERKVDVAAARIREINPEVRVAAIHGDVAADVGLGVYRRMDVVLGCTDNRAARLAVNRACWRAGVPWIDGALEVLMGMVRVFVPPDSACYECTMTSQDYALMNLRYSCPLLRPGDLLQGRVPTTPVSASLIGGLQVQEAVKLLHGHPIEAGCGIYYNGQTLKLSVLRYRRREDCGSHVTYGTVAELPLGGVDLSVGRVLAEIRRRAGPDAMLCLDQEIVSAFSCPQCGQVQRVYRPFDAVMPAGVPCPHCGGDRLPSVATRLSPDLDTSVAALAIRQLGIPPLHVLRVDSGGGEAYYEIAADAPAVFAAWEGPP